MARRKNLYNPAHLVEKVKVARLIARMQKHALHDWDEFYKEEHDPRTVRQYEKHGGPMSPSAITAGKALLDKIVPDLASVKHEGDGPGGSFPIQIVQFTREMYPELAETSAEMLDVTPKLCDAPERITHEEQEHE